MAFEVASVAELETVLRLVVPAPEVHFNNPIKPREHVAAAARAGVKWYVIDSVDELTEVASVEPDVHLSLRIETQYRQRLAANRGDVSRSGGDSAPARELGADVAGVAFHVGSQCRNLDNWRIGIENAKLVFDLMRGQGGRGRSRACSTSEAAFRCAIASPFP